MVAITLEDSTHCFGVMQELRSKHLRHVLGVRSFLCESDNGEADETVVVAAF
jgi:hypothetical protein